MILSCQSISKSFGTDEILKDVSFHIEANEKAAIVGINGAGKSTLLKIIMGEETSDAGEVILAKDKTIGYLAQYQDVSGHRTIYDEVLYARTDILEMEQKLRDMESEMNSRTGEELEKLMDIYHRQSHEFEQQGGYAYRSEVTGILNPARHPERPGQGCRPDHQPHQRLHLCADPVRLLHRRAEDRQGVQVLRRRARCCPLLRR